jgi:hypothetical protein
VNEWLPEKNLVEVYHMKRRKKSGENQYWYTCETNIPWTFDIKDIRSILKPFVASKISSRRIMYHVPDDCKDD